MSSRARRALAAALGALAIFSLLLSTLGIWVRATVSDSDEVAAIAATTLDHPEVRGELARWISDQVLGLVDVEEFVADSIPPEMGRLAPLVSATVDDQVLNQVDRLLATPEARRLLESSTRQAHQAALRLLRGEGLVDGFTVTDGEISFNALPLIGMALPHVQRLGLLTSVELPDLAASGDPAEQIADLEEALDRDLPHRFGQFTVFRSDAVRRAETFVSQAQYAVAAAQRALWVAIGLTVVLIASTLAVAPSRRRALFFLGLAGAAVLLLARWAVDRAVAEAPHLVASPAQQAAVVTALTDAVSSLITMLGVLTAVSVVVAAVYLVRGGELRRDGSTAVGVLVGAVLLGLVGLSLPALLVAVAVAIVVAAGLRRLDVPRIRLSTDSAP